MESRYIQNATDLGRWIGELFPDLKGAKGIAVVRTLFNGIATSLYTQVKDGVTDPHVQIQGFGSTRVVKRQPRRARNPKTGEEVRLGERYTLKWTPSDGFKSALNDPKGQDYFKSLPVGLPEGFTESVPVSSRNSHNGKSAFNQLEFESMENVDRVLGRSRATAQSLGGGSSRKSTRKPRATTRTTAGGPTVKPGLKTNRKPKATLSRKGSSATRARTTKPAKTNPDDALKKLFFDLASKQGWFSNETPASV